MPKSSSTHGPELRKPRLPSKPQRLGGWRCAGMGCKGKAQPWPWGIPPHIQAGHPAPTSAASLQCSGTRTQARKAQSWESSRNGTLGSLLTKKTNLALPPVPPLSPSLVTLCYVPDSNQIRLNQRWSGQRMRQGSEQPSAAGGCLGSARRRQMKAGTSLWLLGWKGSGWGCWGGGWLPPGELQCCGETPAHSGQTPKHRAQPRSPPNHPSKRAGGPRKPAKSRSACLQGDPWGEGLKPHRPLQAKGDGPAALLCAGWAAEPQRRPL